MTDSRVELHQDGHTLCIQMRREEKRNAIDRAMTDALDAALNRLEDDRELWVGVLAGTERAFSAGSDLSSAVGYQTERGGEYGLIRRSRRKPLIAAVEGPALGGGLELVLACDLVVASTTASFGLPEVRRGVIPTCAALFRAPRSLPVNLARQLILTGEPIDASRAHAVGFVNVLCEPGASIREAMQLAAQVGANSPLSVQACLAAVNGLLGDDDDQGWAATSAALESIVGTVDVQEGIAAFFEKRRPRWQGK